MSKLRFLAILFWTPFLLEASFIPIFSISIPGSPLTLGRICLVALGLIGQFERNKLFGPSQFRRVIFLILFGTLIGTMSSENIARDFISYLGFSLLLLSAYGASSLLYLPETQKIIKFFFYASVTYWILYVFGMTLSGGKLATYGEVYRESRYTDSSLVNYHAFGMILSTGIVYLSQINDWLQKFTFIGTVYILAGVMVIFITESRANLLITLFVLFVFYAANNRLKFKLILQLSILLLLFSYLANMAMQNNERLNNRFNVQNTDYIKNTTESRFAFIYLTLDELRDLPFGGGVKNNRVNYFGVEYQPHNQYLTFILFAGMFGFIAVILWIFIFYKTAVRIIRFDLNYTKPHLGASLVIMLTLLTNDTSGAFFLFMIMMITWLVQVVLSPKKIKLR